MTFHAEIKLKRDAHSACVQMHPMHPGMYLSVVLRSSGLPLEQLDVQLRRLCIAAVQQISRILLQAAL